MLKKYRDSNEWCSSHSSCPLDQELLHIL